MKLNIIKVIMTCLTWSVFSSAYGIQALIAIRHAEDYHDSVGLTTQGIARAEAYTHLFRNSSSQWIAKTPPYVNFDPIGKIIYLVNYNPNHTVQPLITEYKNESQYTIDFKKYPAQHTIIEGKEVIYVTELPANYATWDSTFRKSLLIPGHSTLISLSRQSFWTDSKDPGDNNFLFKLLKDSDTKSRDYIRNTGSPTHGVIYIFTQQDPMDGKFGHVDAYLQRYTTYNGTGGIINEDLCDGRIENEAIKKIKITSLGLMPGTFTSGYPAIPAGWDKCEWWD